MGMGIPLGLQGGRECCFLSVFLLHKLGGMEGAWLPLQCSLLLCIKCGARCVRALCVCVCVCMCLRSHDGRVCACVGGGAAFPADKPVPWGPWGFDFSPPPPQLCLGPFQLDSGPVLLQRLGVGVEAGPLVVLCREFPAGEALELGQLLASPKLKRRQQLHLGFPPPPGRAPGPLPTFLRRPASSKSTETRGLGTREVLMPALD